MKKVGILTYHKSINYGSVLQAWALQEIIKKLGYDVCIVDYEPRAYEYLYSIFRPLKSYKDVVFNIKKLPLYAILKKQERLFYIFREKYLILTNQSYEFQSDLRILRKEFDCVVCGSDQIWNIKARDCDPIYFFPVDFSGKKIAYAVSVNDANFDETYSHGIMKEWILDFSSISCREVSGAQKISRFIGADKIDTNLDPTLLLTKQDYENIMSEGWINRDYIFLYNVWSEGDAVHFAKKLSERLHLPVVAELMQRGIRQILKLERNKIIIEKEHTSPNDFLSLIYHARYVVTDSFHGTAFSIIFEKNFFCVNERLSFGNLKNDERLRNILTVLDLKDRFFSLDNFETIKDLQDIKYNVVTKTRIELAKRSIEWLHNAIEK